MLMSLTEDGFKDVLFVPGPVMLDRPRMQAKCGGSEIFLYHRDFQSTVCSSPGDPEGHMVGHEQIHKARGGFCPFFQANGLGSHELLF